MFSFEINELVRSLSSGKVMTLSTPNEIKTVLAGCDASLCSIVPLRPGATARLWDPKGWSQEGSSVILTEYGKEYFRTLSRSLGTAIQKLHP